MGAYMYINEDGIGPDGKTRRRKMSSITELNALASKVFSQDTNILIARAPVWGNEDICFLVYGTDQDLVSAMLSTTLRNVTIRQETGGGFRGSATYPYRVVEGLPL